MNIIKSLPFFFKSHNDSENGGYPKSFPFNLYYDNELKMFRQKTSIELNTLLDEIYENGSLVEGSTSSESGKVYVNKILNYLFQHFKFIDNSKILEIGFGSGILLKELKNKGVKNLFGIEPGNHSRIDGLDGIELIKDFYPSNKLTSKMDLIFSFGIIEHIENPLSFLEEQIKQLSENGKIIFGVPNCEPYLKVGDLSIFLHEHFNYFTKESIVKLINKTNFNINDISIIEGALFVTICKTNYSNLIIDYDTFTKEIFTKHISSQCENIDILLNKYSQSEIAIYAPIRALNILFITNNTSVRLVDDNSELHGRYLPSLVSKVESYDELLLNPPKCLLIFSRTFGDRIKQKCQLEKKLENTLIITLNDLENKLSR